MALGENGGDALKEELWNLLRGWWLVALCAVLFGIASLAWSLVHTPVYSATASLYVTSGTEASAQSAYQGSLASEQRVASYARLVDSDVILQKAVDSVGGGLTLEDARAAVSASVNPDTVFLSVHALDEDPAVATRLSNAVSTAMVDYVASLERPAGGGSPLAKLTVVSMASSSSEPVYPRTGRSLLIAISLGIVTGCVIVLGRARFNSVIRSKDELESTANVPVLSVIPRDTGLKEEHGVVDFSGGSLTAEAFRRLRTNLNFASVDRDVVTVLVTSARAGEGKSTCSLSLAGSVAELGRSVLLIDADLRRPALSSRLSLAGSVGLTTVLSGGVDLSSALQASRIPGLTLLPAGAIPPNAAELLASTSMRDLLSVCRKMFDWVIIDSAPLLPVVDAAVLSSLVDAVVLIAQAQAVRRGDVESAVDLLRQAQAPLIGSVLNGVKESEFEYSNYLYSRTDS